MDKYSKEVRSQMMSKVRSTGNRSTEKRLRARIVSAGLSGWRMHAAELPGKPDFVFDAKRLIVFVHGCFWHGCLTCCRMPGSRQEYWNDKIQGNMRRDQKRCAELESQGWRVLIIWEHELKTDPTSAVNRIREALLTDSRGKAIVAENKSGYLFDIQLSRR